MKMRVVALLLNAGWLIFLTWFTLTWSLFQGRKDVGESFALAAGILTAFINLVLLIETPSDSRGWIASYLKRKALEEQVKAKELTNRLLPPKNGNRENDTHFTQ